MKKLSLLLIAFILSSFTLPARAQQDNDRKFLLDYFNKTGDDLLDSVEGLSPAQMHFKPADDRWSVAECLEHIIVIDKALFDMAVKLIEQPANPERKSEVTNTDEKLIAGITDRSQKAQAPDFGIPKGIYSNTSDALTAFKEQREKIKAYIQDTPENLRDHITDMPGGTVDAYQFFLFIAGHGARHTLQIEEVKAHPDFPSQK